jgi:serine/threonine protein kinase
VPFRLVIVRVHQALRDTNSPGTVLGTPEFMAPELYTEFYDETVDIYAFGLVILEMISRETPYSECTNIGMIIHKVTSGVLPDVLDRVKIPNLKEFVQFCLGKQGTVYAADEQGTYLTVSNVNTTLIRLHCSPLFSVVLVFCSLFSVLY